MSHITVTPFLWYDDNAESAMRCYLDTFDTTEEISEQRLPHGSLFIADISGQGQRLVLKNGGPRHPPSDVFSLAVSVETQDEIDRITETLIDGAGQQGRYGWLIDAFGLSWQIVPTALERLMSDPHPIKSQRVQAAMLHMDKLSIQGLHDAYDGTAGAAA